MEESDAGAAEGGVGLRKTQHLDISRPVLTFGNYTVGFKEDTQEMKVSSFALSQAAILLQDVKPEVRDIRTTFYPCPTIAASAAHSATSSHSSPSFAFKSSTVHRSPTCLSPTPPTALATLRSSYDMCCLER
jgi:hypothetical protein